MAEQRWSVVRATTHFDELLDQVIMTRKPVFIEGECWTAVLISMVEWESFQAKLMHRAPSDLWKIAC
jgi:PHD/YefM family antitoxin component YafN of YafNO toxin-antitoxin module